VWPADIWPFGCIDFIPERESVSGAFCVVGAGIEPHVGHILPLKDAAKALELLQGGNFAGKIVLTR